MHQTAYIVFGILSAISIVAAACFSRKAYTSKGRGKRILTSLHLFTIGVFIATVLIFLPVYYTGYPFGDPYAFIRPLLVSVHHTFRVFILDGEFDAIRDALDGVAPWPHALFSFYAACLFITAPVLTFSNVLSLFKNLRGEMRFYWQKKRPFYIFSELNERSAALAESVLEEKKDSDPVIVFTDVFEKQEEEDYELLLRVHDMNAICLKKDITALNVRKKKEQIEFFLMGESDTENIAQAIKLIEDNRDFARRSIYLFSARASAGYILDSIEKGSKTVSESLIQFVEKNPVTVLDKFDELKYQVDEGFYLHRIDSAELLAQRVLRDGALLEPLFAKAREDGTISILLVGLGKSGREFLRTALWLYQISGMKLEINVVDSKSEAEMKKSLAQEWPEIIALNPMDVHGDACYTINFIGGVDCFTADFDALFETNTRAKAENAPAADTKENRPDLSKTQLAIVTLGDDEKNIETAVTLRRIFEYMAMTGRMVKQKSQKEKKPEKESPETLPMIYSVVYDDKKAVSLTRVGGGAKGLVNCKEVSYNIHFIGSLKSQYSYEVIEEQKRVEASALKQHLDWVTKTRQLRTCYYDKEGYQDFKDAAKEHFDKLKMDYLETQKEPEKLAAEWVEPWADDEWYIPENGRPNYDKPDPAMLKKAIEQYFKFEYFRLSSIAKAIQKEIITDRLGPYFDRFDEAGAHIEGVPVCSCGSCVQKRVTEHMRWNVYMRTIGYRFNEKRSDMAKLHNNLTVWDDLNVLERYKD